MNPELPTDLVPTLHAYQRAQERYGLQLTREVNRFLVGQILGGFRARKMGAQERAEIWYVHTPVGPANVLFDRKKNAIITFLPKGINNVKGVKVPVIPTARPRPERTPGQALEMLRENIGA